MNGVEDKLRAAILATAEELRPADVPPISLDARSLDAPARGRRAAARRSGGRPRRWLRAGAPLAAAAAVLAVVAVTATVNSGGRPAPAAGRHIAAGWAAALPGVPQYYVALSPGNEALFTGQVAVVRSTATGKVLATVRPPRPYRASWRFKYVAAAGDDRTFVLTLQEFDQGFPLPNSPTILYLLRLHPARGTVSLSRAPLPKIPYRFYPAGIALSPDASRLAVASDYGTLATIDVFTLATGAMRRWTWREGGNIEAAVLGGVPLSWAQDGRTLAFARNFGGARPPELRLLDTAAPGHSLRASTLISRFTGTGYYSTPFGDMTLTPDGTTFVAFSVSHSATVLSLEEFSARTGKLAAVLWSQRYPPRVLGAGLPLVNWVSPSGSTVIASVDRPDTAASKNGDLSEGDNAILSGGRLRPLPGGAAPDDQMAW